MAWQARGLGQVLCGFHANPALGHRGGAEVCFQVVQGGRGVEGTIGEWEERGTIGLLE